MSQTGQRAASATVQRRRNSTAKRASGRACVRTSWAITGASSTPVREGGGEDVHLVAGARELVGRLDHDALDAATQVDVGIGEGDPHAVGECRRASWAL